MPGTPNKSSPATSSRRLVVELPAARTTRASSATTSTPTRARTRTASASASGTPVHHTHHELPHLSKADELAADEAEEILEHLQGSARSKRHERLSRLREQSHVSIEDEGSIGDEIVAIGRNDGKAQEGDGGKEILSAEEGADTYYQETAAVDDVDATQDGGSEADMIQSSGIVPSVSSTCVAPTLISR